MSFWPKRAIRCATIVLAWYSFGTTGLADDSQLKADIAAMADQISGSVGTSTATHDELVGVYDKLRSVQATLRSGTLPGPTDPLRQLDILLGSGQPSSTQRDLLGQIRDIASLEDDAVLANHPEKSLELLIQIGALNDEQKTKVQTAADEVRQAADADGYAICIKRYHPSYCAARASLGYGLCTIGNHPSYCSPQASLGYGICSLFYHPSYCSAQATLGYGFCTAKHHPSYCSPEGTLGYGLCAKSHHPSYCAANATLGYAVCTEKYHPSYCSADATLGYGLCTKTYHPSYCAAKATLGYGACATAYHPSYCTAESSVGFGICAMHNHPSYCRADASVSYGICSVTHHPSQCAN